MGKIDMNKIKADTVNSTEIDELKNNEQAEPNEQPAELINNASETTEDTNEINKETEAKEESNTASSKVVVRYVGSGIWKDSEGKLWASVSKSENILNERQYDIDEYENRDDIKFMIKYGTMTETYIK